MAITRPLAARGVQSLHWIKRDRALAMQLAYGTVQRRATLDYVAERLTSRPIKRLDAPVRAALELGLFQLLFLDRIPVHAAVNETVGLLSGRGAGLAKLPRLVPFDRGT